MTMETGKNLRITGQGGAGGGHYDKVKIVGNGSVSGPVQCQTIRSIGSAIFHNEVKARSVHATGTIHFNNDLHVTEKIKLSGNAEVEGAFTFNKLECGGNIHVRGRTSGEELKINGQLQVGSDFAAEALHARGSLNISGLLNAGTLVLKMYGPCSAAEIGGDHISIRLGGVLGVLNKWFKTSYQSILTVDSIEGEDIYLENTHARIVRGNHIKLGAGCDIGLVEYKSHLDSSDRSVVKERNRI